MEWLQQLLGPYADVISGLSLGTLAIVGIRIFGFFKKDKLVLSFMNNLKQRFVKLFGKAEVETMITKLSTLRVNEVEHFAKEKWEEFKQVDKKLELMFQVWLATGMLDEYPELKEEVENIVE